ncbi:ABC transporter substrate-binding protein [Cryobacterium melibiosiphilum]|uniref:ABC transporter substrate-binding protein n=1 Tax=Cryobacterium melibiosiphilum TaxID=995039 RepID=A0A3A5MEG6_9MICO|nr:ABC transporter substrate-binding protein [Cryobacterium melibiosiphilum]RJT87525.1 ABC transporter substrate-binding protein [Cryobacterium melibiosiphilum]
MKLPMKVMSVAAVAAVVASLAACSTGAGSGADAATANLDARGPITYVQGKDNSGIVNPLVEKWNADHPDERVTFKELTDEADQQHDDMVQNLQAQNKDYDVMSVDLVWTAEFAAKGWLQPLDDAGIDTSGMLQSTVDSGTYNDILYAAPVTSDGGILYYRTDLVPEPPTTWDEMMAMCPIAAQNGIACYAGQFAKYEGLTVNATEAINSAGGTVIDDEGNPALETDAAEQGLQNLADAYANGNIPAEAITYTEEEGRIAFQGGKLMFLRNWPYVYNLASTEGSSAVKDVLGMAALPGTDGPGASSLGGHNAAISVYSDTKATAIDFVKFLTSEENQRFYATQGSLAPTLSALYDDEALISELPYLPVLKTSIENAVPRPVTPFYPAVTNAIQDNAYAAIKGEKTVTEAMTDMQNSIESAGSQ